MKCSLLVTRFAGACALAFAATTAFAEQPDKWVRYVESTGNQWVDTGITGRPNTKIECQVEWMNLADSAFVACGDYSANKRFYMCYCLNTTGVVNVAQGVNTTVKLKNGWETRFEKNRIYNYTATFSATNGAGKSTSTVNIDGIGGWSMENSGINTGRSLYVFASNRKNDAVAGKSKSRCYGLKIWQGPENGGNMTLVRDFQPCMKGDRAGLYDAVSGTIFYSISGTELVCDANSEEPDKFIEYVESQGVSAEADGQKPAYIDTGITGKAGIEVEFKETNLEQDTKEHCVLGARDANNRFFLWFHASGEDLGLGYGSTYWRPVTTDPTKAGAWDDPNRYRLYNGDTTHALVSFAAGSQTFKAIDDATHTTNLWTSLSIADSINTGKNLYLFARNNNGTVDAFSRSRLYYLTIKQNGNVVRKFKPCLKNGVAGLYDEVSKRIFYSLGTPLVYNNVYRQNVKPKEVAFVEYIESDGNNTLDTGVPAKSGIRAKGKMAWLHEDENGTGQMRTWNREVNRYLEETAAVFWRQKRAYLGARDITTSNKWFNLIHESDSLLKAQYGGSGELSAKSGGADVALYVTTNYTFDVTFANGQQTMKLNDVQVLNATSAGSVDTGDTLHLFSSSHWRWRSEARCYGLQLWQDGTLVRDFKPCLVEGKGMLYDTVTKSIYRPSPDIPASRVGNIILSGDERPAKYVDYVETDGKQFIDTGVIGKAATTAEFKETSLQKRSDVEECFLGSFGTSADTRFYMWYHAWGETAGIGYGVYWRPKDNDPYTTATDSSDPNVYKLNKGTTTHARISFADGLQTFKTINDATGTETLWSSRSLSGNINTGRKMYLFAKNDNASGEPKSPAASRFYFLKIWQDGNLVRSYRPVMLTNGVVALWDFVNREAYLPKSTIAPYNYTIFPVVGPTGAEIKAGLMIIIK